SQQFFGEGTFLSSNANAIQGASGNTFDFFNTSEENLFTRKSFGASLFASAPLSEFYRKRPFTQFSRVGLSYQLSESSVEDPAVNTSGSGSTQFIPVIYAQPNIITSRVTGTFVYDTRNGSIDPTKGRSLSMSVGLAGLGGDVRTYQPSLEFTQFYPVRNKRSENPHVFGFRIIAGTVGSFATTEKVKNANSLAFVEGVPIYERYFLGDEFTIRGYNVRSISPVTPLDNFVTSRNVVFATNTAGAANVVPLPAALTAIGTFTGATGANVVNLQRVYTATGGDTQVLGNFEYRIPIVGHTVQAALFVDVGSSFNLRSKTPQAYSTEFIADDPFIQTFGLIPCPRLPQQFITISLTTMAACQNFSNLALSPGLGLIARDNRLITRAEYEQAQRIGPVDPLTQLPVGLQQVFLRGDVQRNTVVRLDQSLFDKFTDLRSSIGAEIRVQVPILNVPFRLIYAYNPNARQDQVINGFPFFFDEKKTVFRFSVGRTF
ncbi:MAG TPA: BamA/TamA family outer membrane protein, partial [Pyrinomonadaceae bacterium]|nr:BamA/TamA family outer membrane protein [Pyrinomonadaceae bacterium]